jgi:hypothetical protein
VIASCDWLCVCGAGDYIQIGPISIDYLPSTIDSTSVSKRQKSVFVGRKFEFRYKRRGRSCDMSLHILQKKWHGSAGWLRRYGRNCKHAKINTKFGFPLGHFFVALYYKRNGRESHFLGSRHKKLYFKNPHISNSRKNEIYYNVYLPFTLQTNQRFRRPVNIWWPPPPINSIPLPPPPTDPMFKLPNCSDEGKIRENTISYTKFEKTHDFGHQANSRRILRLHCRPHSNWRCLIPPQEHCQSHCYHCPRKVFGHHRQGMMDL